MTVRKGNGSLGARPLTDLATHFIVTALQSACDHDQTGRNPRVRGGTYGTKVTELANCGAGVLCADGSSP